MTMQYNFTEDTPRVLCVCVPLLAIAYLCGCRESFLISHKRQRRLSGYGYIDVGLPPASPAGSDDTVVWTHN